MQTRLKLRGHIIDSLILSKLLDKISELDVQCYTSDIKIGHRREDVSEAVFIIETNDMQKMNEAVELAQKHGADKTND